MTIFTWSFMFTDALLHVKMLDLHASGQQDASSLLGLTAGPVPACSAAKATPAPCLADWAL